MKDRKKLRIPTHAGRHHVGLLEPMFDLCKEVVTRLEHIRQEGMNDWDYRPDDPDDRRMQMVEDAIAEWQAGLDDVEAEMEYVLMGEMRDTDGQTSRAEVLEEQKWQAQLPAEPRITKAYGKAVKAFARASAEKARALALRGLREAEAPGAKHG